MSIVVTGAGGFVGRHLVERLAAEGRSVVAIDRSPGAVPAGVRSVAGDLADPVVLDEAMRDGCVAVIHLATVPGGAAEADPAEARRVNLDASMALFDAARRAGERPRIVFASSIAVFGDPLPPAVDDATPLAPKMVYGMHKAMVELAAATMHRRGEIDAVSLRLPGVVARPRGPSGMKSAFMSELFHALAAGEPFDCPISTEATLWLQSLRCAAGNLVRGLTVESGLLPESRAITLPALRVTMGALAAEVTAQCGVSGALVRYRPDAAIEAAFGAQPVLATPAAERAGFSHDGSLGALVSRALNMARAGEDCR